MALPLRRSRDVENVDPTAHHHHQQASPSKAQASHGQHPAAPVATTSNNKAAAAAAASPVHQIKNETQLRALMEKGEFPHHNAEWVALIVHAPWAWPNFDANRGLLRCCTERGEPVVSPVCSGDGEQLDQQQQQQQLGWPWIVKHSQVPIASVSVADMDNGGNVVSIIGIREQGLPLVCLLRRRNITAGYECVAAKPIKNCIDIVSQTLLPPVTNAAELDATLRRASADSNGNTKLLVGYVGAAWCPPCCRVLSALPDIAAAFAPKGMQLVKMDYDVANKLVAEQLGIEKIPTFVAFRPSDAADASSGVRMPFGSLQHSDAVRVSDQMGKWCDLANVSQQQLTDDMFNDDF